MQGQIETKTLKAGLKRLSAFADSRPSLPILEYVHVSVHHGWAHLTVYDMEKSLTVKVPIDDGKPCSVAVRFRDFRKIIDKIKADTISIDFSGDTKARISAGNLDFTLNAKPGGEYPRLPEADDVATTSDTTWSDFISEAVFVKAASSMGTPKNFTSTILFAYRDDTLELVGTDGRRLHLAGIDGKHQINPGGESNHVALVPTATIHALAKLKLKADAPLRIGFAEHLMIWSVPSEGIEGVSHLLDTPFPDYGKVIPDSRDSRFQLDVKATLESLDALTPVATQQDGRDMVVVTANGTINLSAKSETMGSAEAEVPCEHVAGPEAKFALNVHFFIETLKLADGEVTMSNNGALEPTMFEYPGTERVAVVMPVRLPE